MPIRPINRSLVPSAPPSVIASSPDLEALPEIRPDVVARSRVRQRVNIEAGATSTSRAPVSVAQRRRAHHTVDRTGPNWTEDGDYIVGKGRPPVEPQWKKGQSGNPRGPKKKEELTPQQAFEKEFLAEFKMKVNGEDVSMNIGTFTYNLMKKEAVNGSLRAQIQLFNKFCEIIGRQVPADAPPELVAWENQMIQGWLDELGLPAKPVIRKPRINPDDQDQGDAS